MYVNKNEELEVDDDDDEDVNEDAYEYDAIKRGSRASSVSTVYNVVCMCMSV